MYIEDVVNYENNQVILLTNNTVLISEIEEVGADVGEPDCKLINPYIITTSDQKNYNPR